ncbi:MAG: GGDEF domain-containing protein [Gammaproteobacteria bacterium]|nr:GGDEF domain-containing protein [Gammaproteobacteria bacterium]
MSDETNKTEVVEQLEESQIDLMTVHWEAGEKNPGSDEQRLLDSLREERGKDYYSDLLFVLLGNRYSSKEAQKIWDKLVSHRDSLVQALGRNPGIVVAALDWQTNFQNNTEQLSLIESSKLEDVRESAVVDGLTGLYDHDTVLMLLKKELERAKRHSEKCSVLMLDLDDFKKINDEFGHQKGDEVLIRLADIMRENLRTIDTPGRYGGEEFIAILPETDKSAAIQSGERLRKAVKNKFSQDIFLTISIGVACFPADGSSVDALLKNADSALYQAKDAGKDRVVA